MGKNGQHNHSGENKSNLATTNTLKGMIKEIEWHVFDCTYTTNNKKVTCLLKQYANYIATKLTMGSKVLYMIEKEQRFPFVTLTYPAQDMQEGAMLSWETVIQYKAKNEGIHWKTVNYKENWKFGQNIFW